MRGVSVRSIVGLVVASAFVATTVSAVQQKPAPGRGAAGGGKSLKNPEAPSPESVKAGAKIFADSCVDCHGKGAKGDGSGAPEGSQPANLTDAKWDHGGTDGEIFTTIKNGVGPKFDMDGFKETLSDKEIWQVVNFLRSIGPATAKRE